MWNVIETQINGMARAKGHSEVPEMNLGTRVGPTHKGPYNDREVGRAAPGNVRKPEHTSCMNLDKVIQLL